MRRCPECGTIDFKASFYHLVCYLLSSRYRQALREAEVESAFWRKLTERPRIKEGEALNWQEVDLSQLMGQ